MLVGNCIALNTAFNLTDKCRVTNRSVAETMRSTPFSVKLALESMSLGPFTLILSQLCVMKFAPVLIASCTILSRLLVERKMRQTTTQEATTRLGRKSSTLSLTVFESWQITALVFKGSSSFTLPAEERVPVLVRFFSRGFRSTMDESRSFLSRFRPPPKYLLQWSSHITPCSPPMLFLSTRIARFALTTRPCTTCAVAISILSDLLTRI
mmetsp:Transcript_5387/g.7940  ORF Transcript_5387/g.7940 Transcript_5387/m.7940 type:complete len:210 (-) Transcript_5387:346-975(-)